MSAVSSRNPATTRVQVRATAPAYHATRCRSPGCGTRSAGIGASAGCGVGFGSGTAAVRFGSSRTGVPLTTVGRAMREVHVDGLRHVLDTLPVPGRFVYVSSTGVYGQTDGSWVDESSPTEPAEEAGRVVLEAERLLRERLPAAVVLRFAGIYGPDRLLRGQAVRNGEPLVGDPEKWLNLIHV